MKDDVKKQITAIWVTVAEIHDRISNSEEAIYTTLIKNWNEETYPAYQIVNMLVIGGMTREKADQLVTKVLGEEDYV